MDCPEPALLADLVHGQARSLEAADVTRHLGECSQCVDVVAAVVASSWASERTSPEPPRWPQASEVHTQTVGGAEVTQPMVYRGAAIIPPGTRLGRYRVRRWLGRGGMGEVYEGYDPELDRRVALKLLRTRGNDDATAQRRLRREAQTLARLSSPHVVAALDVGVFGGALFLVMELVEGPTLAAWLSQKPRDWREILDMFLAAGEGLAAAHEVGVIHRDFKPQNVLIGADGKPRVSDFGLARETEDQRTENDGGSDTDDGRRPAVSDGQARTVETVAERFGRPVETTGPPDIEPTALTRTGIAIGTPRYMAPEQFLRRPIDARVASSASASGFTKRSTGSIPSPTGRAATAQQAEHPPPAQSTTWNPCARPCCPGEPLRLGRGVFRARSQSFCAGGWHANGKIDTPHFAAFWML